LHVKKKAQLTLRRMCNCRNGGACLKTHCEQNPSHSRRPQVRPVSCGCYRWGKWKRTFWHSRTEASLKRSEPKFKLVKATFNVKKFICRFSWSISSDFGKICCWNVCRSRELTKKSIKSHRRSLILVPIKSQFTTSSWWLIATLALSHTVSEIWRPIG